ncbi:MAG: cellulase family glycosylhydrolase [Chloroflexota bacterium]
MRNVAPTFAALIAGATLLLSPFVGTVPSHAESPAAATPTAAPIPMRPALSTADGPAVYRARSPEYGMNIFVWGNPSTTDRDLGRVRDAGFTWQKTLFKWRDIEPVRGQFNWAEADRVVKASKAAGVKIIARLDFQPTWARVDGAHNGPPDNYEDFGRFVTELANRYRSDSPIGPVQAIEVWNEPNLAREWGQQPVNQAAAGDYVRLLKTAYEATKAVDPSIIIITAGLSPTGWNDDTARPDDLYLQWMYDAGAKAYFDVLGAHGPGFKAPPNISPEEAASSPVWGGHRSFTFRRVEDLRQIMVDNDDAAKQIWLLEFGWTTDTINPAYAWHRVTPEQHAEYLVAAYKWAHANWSPWIGVMALWTLPDPQWQPEREELWWSVGNQDGTDRPALTRLRDARRTGELP